MTLSEDIITEYKISEIKTFSDHEYLLPMNATITLMSQEINNMIHHDLPNSQNTIDNMEPTSNGKAIMEKYFEKWRNFVKQKTTKYADQIQFEKLDEFITNLKNHQQPTLPNAPKPFKNCKHPKPSELFKNRYKAQKSIINLQRSKIEEQNKLINELKLGIIREDLLKSIESTKFEIREIFSNSSEKLLFKAPLLKAVEEREQIMVQSQKAPKMVQKMQQRAIERAKYREVILERKKLIEEARQKLLEAAIEKKKALEEEERKRNLEIINEQRKRELHLQKVRHEKRQQFEAKLKKSDIFYSNLLLKQCFRKLFNHYFKSVENNTLAISYDLHKQKYRTFKTWLGYIETKYKVKYSLADVHWKFKVLKNTFSKLKEWKMESVRSFQAAEDLYDFRLTCNTFVFWHRLVCKQIMLDSKKNQIATNHSNRRILFQYFYQWRSLPVVVQLEKAKEEKKRKWREKVWEILPDYRPPEHI